MAAPRQIVETIVLIGAIAAQAAVVYGVTDSVSRVVAGALLLAVIMAVTVRLAKVEVTSQVADEWVPNKRYHKRRYLRLRGTLERFIEEVRRLNRVAVDAHRGFRSRDSAQVEMERIETQLVGMVREFREAAGIESDED